MNKNKKTETVVILGAGLAGLSAGYELSKAGKKVIILEKLPVIGGLAKTISYKGFKFDTGPHRWYTKNNKIDRWMLDILGSDVIKVPRLTRIYFDGKFFYYPIRLMNTLGGIGFVRAFIAVLDYILAKINAMIYHPTLLTMEDGYINQFGKTLYETFFKRYSEKLWGQDCDQISVDWVGQRTRGLNIFTLIQDTIFKKKDVVSLVDEFSYPQKGIGTLSDKMAATIRKHNGKILLNSEVTKINLQKNKIISVNINNGKKETVTGDQFISSIPLNELVMELYPAADPIIRNISSRLKYRDEILVVLLIKKANITRDTWIYIHPKEIPFMRVMEMDNWSDKLSKKGTTSLVFEIACNSGDKTWKKSNREIAESVKNAYIDEFKAVSPKDVIGSYVYRVLKEYPVYHIDYKRDVNKLNKYLSKISNLQIVGRNGTFRYNNMDHSIEMGLYAAWNIISKKRKYSIESVNIEREYLEEKKDKQIDINS